VPNAAERHVSSSEVLKVLVSKIHGRMREAPRVAHKAGANQTKQGVSLDCADIRISIRTIYAQTSHDMR